MKDFLIYILQSGVCLSFFGIVYLLFLRKETFFKFNRAFLLIGVLTSFFLPSMQFTYDVVVSHIPQIEEMALSSDIQNEKEADLDVWKILSFVYLLGVMVVLFRNLFIFWNLKRLKQTGNISVVEGCQLVNNIDVKTPFSLLNRVYMNIEGLQHKEREIILKHEISHINQKHWIDLLCSECALILQWFNPLMWYYIHLQKENHEYLADQAVLQSGESTAVYRAVLINQRFQGPVFSFANSFNYSNQQNRLNMMKKTTKSPWRKIAVLGVLPLFGVFFTLSAKPNYVTVEKKESASINVVGVKAESGDMKKAMLIVDGMEKPNTTVESIDTETIESMDVYTGQEAIDKYGDKGKDGVIEVKTKEASSKEKSIPADVLYIVDGKEVKDIKHLDSSKIERVDVLKDEASLMEYGAYGKSGVILVTTKK